MWLSVESTETDCSKWSTSAWDALRRAWSRFWMVSMNCTRRWSQMETKRVVRIHGFQRSFDSVLSSAWRLVFRTTDIKSEEVRISRGNQFSNLVVSRQMNLLFHGMGWWHFTFLYLQSQELPSRDHVQRKPCTRVACIHLIHIFF